MWVSKLSKLGGNSALTQQKNKVQGTSPRSFVVFSSACVGLYMFAILAITLMCLSNQAHAYQFIECMFCRSKSLST